LFNLSTCYFKMGDQQKAGEYYDKGVRALENETDESLNFMLSEDNISVVRSSTGQYQRVKSELEELEVTARDRGRTDV
jgi:hypothetical protein